MLCYGSFIFILVKKSFIVYNFRESLPTSLRNRTSIVHYTKEMESCVSMYLLPYLSANCIRHYTRGGGKAVDHRGHIHSHRGQTFCRRGQNSHRGVRFMTTVATCNSRSHAALAQFQKHTRDSSNNQRAGIPCFQRFSRYSVHSLCIK